MTGLSNYSADFLLEWVTGQNGSKSVWLALFTAVGSDSGSGFTEVDGAGYTRVQVAGLVETTESTATSSAVLNFGANNVPAWVQTGMVAYDFTTPGAITGGQTVEAINATAGTVTLSGDVNATVNSGDEIAFSAFGAPSGTSPSQSANVSAITFAQATANWGTAIAFGLYDALTGGDLLLWDFMGNYSWLPCSVTDVDSGNGAVYSTHAHGFNDGDPIVQTSEYGGTLPTTTQGTVSGYNVNYAANVTTDTFTLSSVASGQSSSNAVWTSTSGDVMARKITQQIIPQNVTASFAASTFTINVA